MAATTSGNRSALQQRSSPVRSQRISADPQLSVVVINYCQWKNTARLVRQLRRSKALRHGAAEIVIVDNHSPVNRMIGKLRRAECVSLRRFKRNFGFARAVNEGCRLSRGRWFLLLNPDVTVSPDFLDQVSHLMWNVESLEPRIGVIGLGVQNSDGSAQPSCGAFPTLRKTVSRLLWPRAFRRCQLTDRTARTGVAWATGCAMLIRKECLDDIAGFDEDFFLYYEDVDFCRRAAERGWAICHEPKVTVTHHTPLHSREVSPPMRLVTRHALLTYGLKHWSRMQSAVLGGLIWMEASMRQFAAWCRGRDRDGHFHRQTRKLVGHLLGARHREVNQSIREAASQLAAGALALDGQAV